MTASLGGRDMLLEAVAAGSRVLRTRASVERGCLA